MDRMINIERRLKTLESSNEEISLQSDRSKNETNAKIKELEAKISNTDKTTTTNSTNIEEIKNTLDNITRKSAEETSHEISHDNPDKNEISITYANLVEKGLTGSSQQNKASSTPPS